jgi:hemolysin III
LVGLLSRRTLPKRAWFGKFSRMNTSQPSDAVCLSVADERANTITHGSGVVLSFIALAVLAVHPSDPAWPVRISAMVYAITMGVVYFCSTMSHAVYEPVRRNRWRAWDQGTIYCLIAGTYTPFIWSGSPSGWRIPLLAAVWVAALSGFYSKVFAKHRINGSSTVTYVLLGWLPAIPLFSSTPTICLYWMVAGGLAYTAGIYFLINDHRFRYCHAIWHLAVIAGSTCHFIAIYRLVEIVQSTSTTA